MQGGFDCILMNQGSSTFKYDGTYDVQGSFDCTEMLATSQHIDRIRRKKINTSRDEEEVLRVWVDGLLDSE